MSAVPVSDAWLLNGEYCVCEDDDALLCKEWGPSGSTELRRVPEEGPGLFACSLFGSLFGSWPGARPLVRKPEVSRLDDDEDATTSL